MGHARTTTHRGRRAGGTLRSRPPKVFVEGPDVLREPHEGRDRPAVADQALPWNSWRGLTAGSSCWSSSRAETAARAPAIVV